MNYYNVKEIFNIKENYQRDNKYYNNIVDSKKGVLKNNVPVNKENGLLQIYITKNLGREFPIDAVITIYVKKGDKQIEVKKLIAIDNPTTIELPVANPLGTLIESPEYFFTTYDLTIESLGYYKVNTMNIRLFPNITTKFYYNLNQIIQNENKEEIINLPPHPRDELAKNNIWPYKR